MNDKPIWNRLKNMRCPKCNGVVKNGILSDEVQCSECDFRISAEKFNKIVGDLYRPKAQRDEVEDNLAEWNNYRPEERRERHDEAIEKMFEN